MDFERILPPQPLPEIQITLSDVEARELFASLRGAVSVGASGEFYERLRLILGVGV